MARLFAFGAVLAALSPPLVAMSWNEAAAEQQFTCSEAKANCGGQRVCQRRFEACLETGCWKVGIFKKCGYEKK